MSSGCQSCGACCFSSSDTYVRVTGDDHERFGEAAEHLSQFIGNRCYVRMGAGHCAGLELRRGRFVCSLYLIRPATCRELLQGSPACLAEVSRKKLHARRMRDA